MKYVSFILIIVFSSCMFTPKVEVTCVYDESALKTLLYEFPALNDQQAARALDSIVNVVAKDSAILRQTIAFLKTPVFDPNSSLRNEKLYSKLLQFELHSPWFNQDEKQLAAKKLRLLEQNNIGFMANDFTYISPGGEKHRMYDIQAKYLLLYFNNPDCSACKTLKEALQASNVITQVKDNGILKILSIFPDTDEKLWLHHLRDYPSDWIQGRDEKEFLFKNSVYDLHAIPSMYLLDENKKVLLKDCYSIDEVEKRLKLE